MSGVLHALQFHGMIWISLGLQCINNAITKFDTETKYHLNVHNKLNVSLALAFQSSLLALLVILYLT